MRFVRPALVVSLCLLAAVPSLAQTSSRREEEITSFRDAIQTVYDDWSDAVKRGDIKALGAHRTPDFVEIDIRGKRHTIAEIERGMQRMNDMIDGVNEATTIVQSVDVRSDEATIVELNVTQVRVANPHYRDHKAEVETHVQAVNTWVRKNGEWMLKSVRETASKTIVDGRVVQDIQLTPRQSAPSVRPLPPTPISPVPGYV